MNGFIVIFAALIFVVVAEPPVSNGGEAIEGSNYVDDTLLRRISDILNGGSSGGDSGNVGRGGDSSYSAPAQRTSNSQGYNGPPPQNSYNAPPSRSSPQNSYNAPSSRSSAPSPKPLGRVRLETPELAPVVAAFELDGGIEPNNARSSYGAPSRNGGSY